MSSNNDYSCSNVNVKIYIVGAILSIIMTVIPFLLVINNYASKAVTFWMVIMAAVIQILIHLICFLHLDTKSNAGWNLIAFIFTMIIVSILIIGSIWIMWNLNHNMIVC